MSIRLIAASAVVAFVAVLMWETGGGAHAGSHQYFKNPKEPELTPQLRLGKMNYDIFCAECHGKKAGGTAKGPTFIHRVYHPGHHGDGAFLVAPKIGARAHHWKFGNMKPVKGVVDAQIADIIAYIRAVQKANGLF